MVTCRSRKTAGLLLLSWSRYRVVGPGSLPCSPVRHSSARDGAMLEPQQHARAGPCPRQQDRGSGMRTRLGCLSHKTDSCSDFSAILLEKPSRALKRLTKEEATKWAHSFDLLLSHKYGRAIFRAFLKTEFSDENLEFWVACEEYKKIRSTSKMASKAKKIYQEFIDVQAPREVNIDFQTRELTKRNLYEPTPACFDQAQARVRSLMEKDSYPRFIRSKIYNDVLSHTQRRPS
ncbi:hypothetical protein NDU88_003905 [Pleurodeles waltl]|uniref:Regulator of G-protein signaling 8 n=2 Tax=Pleurodeles waltl TaxID=8319 RepID=A0AAV7T6G0_PLEWA|nr:hypothetical protein NDU88_003905 [Pleurodeles waltl]